MKHLNLIAQIAFLMLSATTMFGQTTQKGFVFEYNDKMQKVPLANVEIVVTNAASTVSDANGEFTLHFRQLKPGDRILIRRCIKPGYSIADESALEHLYITGDDSQVSILLCRTEKLMELRKTMVRQATEKATMRYEDDQKQLTISLKEQSITKAEYDRKLEELRQQYEAKLDNIENYIDRFVKLDLTALTAEEQKIMEYVRDGNFDKAMAAYDKLDLSGRLMRQNQNVAQLEKASKAMSESERQLQDQRKELRNAVLRQAGLCRMQGGSAMNEKVKQLVRDLALVDTTNLYNMLVYARLELEQSDFDTALRIYKSLEQTGFNRQDSAFLLLAQCYQALAKYKKNDYVEALEQMEHSLPLFDAFRMSQTDTLLMLRDEAGFFRMMGDSYARLSDYDKADVYYRRGIQSLRTLRVETRLKDIDSQYAQFLSEASLTMRSFWMEESVQNCREAISIFEELYQKQPHQYDGKLGYSFRCLGSVYKDLGQTEEAESSLLEAEKYYRKAAHRDSKGYNHYLANCLYCLGDLYVQNRDYGRALQCLDESEQIFKNEPNGEHQYAETLSEINYLIGRSAYLMGDYQRALVSNLKAYEDIQPLYQKEPEVYRKRMSKRLIHLCNVYIRLNDLKKAEYYIKRAVVINPNSGDVQRHMKQVNDLLKAESDSIK